MRAPEPDKGPALQTKPGRRERDEVPCRIGRVYPLAG